jgi:uncharacterized OsmC-like protein
MEWVAEHPDEARYTDSAAIARLDRGLRFQVEGADGASLMTDMPESVGGTDAAPSPGWILRAAIASCEGTLIAMRAATEGIELAELEVTVDSDSDDRGILGLDDTVPPGPIGVRVRVRVVAEGPVDDLRPIVEWAHSHCPVTDAVAREVPVTLEIES